MVTSKGVYVCPILIEEPEARMGETLRGDAAAVPAEVRRVPHVLGGRRDMQDMRLGIET